MLEILCNYVVTDNLPNTGRQYVQFVVVSYCDCAMVLVAGKVICGLEMHCDWLEVKC